MPSKPKRFVPTKSRPPENRPSACKRGYNGDWQKASKAFLRTHPLCRRCHDAGRIVGATVVDHVIPHRGDQKLFWDDANWQPLCKACHDRKTANEDGGLGRPRTEAAHGVVAGKAALGS